MLKFERETLDQCREEIIPVLRYEHWEEVGHYKDIPIDMRWDVYAKLEEQRKLRCYTVRGVVNEAHDGEILMGYAFFIVDNHLHYKDTLVANQDILYVRKPYRGIGRSFLSWCEARLIEEKVVTVTQHIKPWFNWGAMAEELGYEVAETIYTKRLD